MRKMTIFLGMREISDKVDNFLEIFCFSEHTSGYRKKEKKMQWVKEYASQKFSGYCKQNKMYKTFFFKCLEELRLQLVIYMIMKYAGLKVKIHVRIKSKKL